MRSSFIENLEGERSPLSFMITKFALRQYPKIAARRHIIKINSGPLVSGSLDVKKTAKFIFSHLDQSIHIRTQDEAINLIVRPLNTF